MFEVFVISVAISSLITLPSGLINPKQVKGEVYISALSKYIWKKQWLGITK